MLQQELFVLASITVHAPTAYAPMFPAYWALMRNKLLLPGCPDWGVTVLQEVCSVSAALPQHQDRRGGPAGRMGGPLLRGAGLCAGGQQRHPVCQADGAGPAAGDRPSPAASTPEPFGLKHVHVSIALLVARPVLAAATHLSVTQALCRDAEQLSCLPLQFLPKHSTPGPRLLHTSALADCPCVVLYSHMSCIPKLTHEMLCADSGSPDLYRVHLQEGADHQLAGGREAVRQQGS